MREAAAAVGAFLLLLSALAGSLSHSHFEISHGLALSQDGGKMAICSGSRMVFVDRDGNFVPGDPGEPKRHPDKCDCCLLMHASAVLPPRPAAPVPLELSAIQILRPGTSQHLSAAGVAIRRNRDPPSQA